MKKNILSEIQRKAEIAALLKERKKEREVIKESELNYRILVENSLVGVFRTKVNGEVDYVNPTILRMLEFDTLEEMLKTGAWMRYKDPKQREELLKSLKDNGKVEGFEANITTKKGNDRIFLLNIVINGEILDGILIDITDRKAAEKALSEAEFKFRTIFDKASDGMLLAENGSSTFYMANSKICEMLGYSQKEILKIGVGDIHLKKDLPFAREQFELLLRKEISLAPGIPVRRKNGTVFYADIAASLVNIGGKDYLLGVFRDISERKNSEEKIKRLNYELEETVKQRTAQLQETLDFNQKIIESSSLGIFACREDGPAIIANPAVARISGASVDQMLKLNFRELDSWKKNGLFRKVETALKTRTEQKAEIHLTTTFGRDAWIYYYITTFISGGKLHFLMMVEDVTERKLAEIKLKGYQENLEELIRERTEELVRSRELLVEAQTMAHLGSWEFDIIKDEISGSEEFYRLFGVTREQIAHYRQFADLLHKDDRERIQHDVDESITNNKPYNTDYRILLSDNKIRYINARGLVYLNAAGEPQYMKGTCLDITERNLTDKIIRDNEQRFRELIESLPQLFWTCRVDGPCDYLSRQWVEYTGIPEDDQLGYRWLEQLHPEDRDRTVSEWMEKVKTGESFDVEFRIRRNDGIYHWFKTRAVPMFDTEGNIVKWFGSNTDFDEIKRAEEQLINFSKDLEQKVEERTKELEAFSYSVSHDLRAPLRHVSGYVELLNKHFHEELSEKGKHYLNSIADSVHLMGVLIDDLLRFSRTGRAEMVKSVIEMDEIVDEIKTAISRDNPNRKIKWILGKLPSVYGDKSMVQLVWQNLLNNAVKFTGIRDTAEIEIGANEEKKEWIFFVKDNGVGFDMQYAHKLFGVFQRLHPTEDYEGTGIGLANVRRIVSRHGGRTWAEAEPDKGAVFNFSIPKNKEDL